MAELKQIEVNGTTYDIGIPGSQLPVVCEMYSASGSGATVVDKLNHGTSEDTYYEISPTIVLKSGPDGDGAIMYSVVIAIPDTALS